MNDNVNHPAHYTNWDFCSCRIKENEDERKD